MTPPDPVGRPKPSHNRDPAVKLAKEITSLRRRVRALELRRDLVGGAGAGGGSPSYAIQVKRKSGGDVVIADGTQAPIPFTNVYFENNNGVMWPPDGGVWPPAAGSSMFTAASPLVLTAPVEGLWGYYAAYEYDSMPLGSYYWTRVDHSNSTPAIRTHAREADAVSATPAYCDVEGTVYMSAGDYLKVWAYQESGGDRSINVDAGAINDDIPESGPVFAMWLIAARV